MRAAKSFTKSSRRPPTMIEGVGASVAPLPHSEQVRVDLLDGKFACLRLEMSVREAAHLAGVISIAVAHALARKS